jgi:hypothetical protein
LRREFLVCFRFNSYIQCIRPAIYIFCTKYTLVNSNNEKSSFEGTISNFLSPKGRDVQKSICYLWGKALISRGEGKQEISWDESTTCSSSASYLEQMDTVNLKLCFSLLFSYSVGWCQVGLLNHARCASKEIYRDPYSSKDKTHFLGDVSCRIFALYRAIYIY